MSPRPKCKDFYCLEVVYYPSKIKALKVKDVDDDRWHTESKILIDAHHAFHNGLMQRVFGRDMNFFYLNYMCYTREVIDELLDVWHNIKYSDREGYHQYLIPIEYTELILWMRLNKPEHSKEPTRYSISWMSWIHQRTELSWTREASDFSRRQREQFPNLPPLEELTEADRLVLT